MPERYLPGHARAEISTPGRSNRGFFILVAVLAVILGGMIIGLLLYVRSLEQPSTTTPEANQANNNASPVNVPVATTTEPVTPTQGPVERDLQRIQDITAMQSALTAYFSANRYYPQVLSAMGSQFLEPIPKDPASQLVYTYEAASDGSSFSVYFTIEEQAIYNNQILNAGLYQLRPNGLTKAGADENPPTAPPGEIPPATTNDADDTDVDGLTSAEEVSFKTNPLVADTDGDGYKDGEEVRNLYSPIASQKAGLDVSGLVRSYDNSNVGYRLWYAEDWVVRNLDADSNEVIFTSPLGDTVTVISETNESFGSLEEWLDARDPGFRTTARADTVAGQTTLRSSDGLIVYFASGTTYFSVGYRAAPNGQIDYPVVYAVMLKSWTFK